MTIADTEGIEAVSMRRVARELGAGTMSLYHYVESKADLLTVMRNAVIEEMLVEEDALPPDWREALTVIAHRMRDTLLRHPWAIGGVSATEMGPGALRRFEQSLSAMAPTGLTYAGKVEIVALVDDFVCGFVGRTDTRPGLDAIPDTATPEVERYLDAQLATGRFPRTADMLGDHDRLTALRRVFGEVTSPDERFALGLRGLLTGIAAELDESGPPVPPTEDTADARR